MVLAHPPWSRVSVGCSAGTTHPGRGFLWVTKTHRLKNTAHVSSRLLICLCREEEACLQRARSSQLVAKGTRFRCHSMYDRSTLVRLRVPSESACRVNASESATHGRVKGGSSEGGSSKSMAPAPRTAGTSAFLARMLQQYGTGSHISE